MCSGEVTDIITTNEVSKRKQDRETEELLKKLGETEEQMRNKISWGSDPNKNAI